MALVDAALTLEIETADRRQCVEKIADARMADVADARLAAVAALAMDTDGSPGPTGPIGIADERYLEMGNTD